MLDGLLLSVEMILMGRVPSGASFIEYQGLVYFSGFLARAHLGQTYLLRSELNVFSRGNARLRAKIWERSVTWRKERAGC